MDYRGSAWAAGALWAALMLTACSGLSPYKYWHVYTMTAPAPSPEKQYRDGRIAVWFFIDEKKIYFHLTNLTDQPMTIDWRRAAYVHIDGVRHKLANIDSLLTDRRNDPPPTIVAPGETIDDLVAPAKNVESLEDLTWYVYPLFNLFNEQAYDDKGKTFGVDLPIKARGEWVTYTFRFRIANVVPGSERL